MDAQDNMSSCISIYCTITINTQVTISSNSRKLNGRGKEKVNKNATRGLIGGKTHICQFLQKKARGGDRSLNKLNSCRI